MKRIGLCHARAGALALVAGLPLLISARSETVDVAGRLIPADGGPVGAAQVVLRDGARIETASVAADGRFTLRGPRGGAELELVVDAAAGSERRFHPVAATLAVADVGDEIRVMMVPRTWTIRAGKHAGTAVPISLERAFAPACFGCSAFFRPGVRDPTNGRLAPSATWPGGVFPIRVAFTGDMPFQRVAPRDSAAFWRIAAELEQEFGRDLLRPAGYRETLPTETEAPEDVILVESDPRLRRVGWGSTISQTGDIIYGAIRVRSAAVFSEREGPRLVKHEVLHALGLGHTCAWRSVMAEIPQCANRSEDAPTPEDVAYFEVLTYTRELQRAFRAQLGLDAALRGQQTGGLGGR